MSRNGVGNLAGCILVFFWHVGQHASEQRNIHGLAAVENGIKTFLDLLWRSAGDCLLALSFSLTFLIGFSRGSNNLIPEFMNSVSQCCHLSFTKEEQVLCLPTFGRLELDIRQGDFCLGHGFGLITLSVEQISNSLVYPLRSYRKLIGTEESFFSFLFKVAAYRPFATLTGHTGATGTAEESIFGCAGIVAVQV